MATKSSLRNTKPRRRPVFMTVGAVGILLIILAILELTHVTNFIHRAPATPQNGPTQKQQKEEEKTFTQQKKQAIENPPPTTSSPVPTANNLSMTTHQETNNTLTVLTNLGTVANGSCTLTASNGSATNTQTATVIYQSQYSTCAGFSVPISSLGSGTWTLSLSVTSNGTTATKSQQVDVR